MIKFDEQTKEITTDCKTVGQFMTEAAAIGCGILSIKVDGCLYEFYDNPKIRVTDDTPLGSVAVERADSLLCGITVLNVTTAPKPKTVKKSGWIQSDDPVNHSVRTLYNFIKEHRETKNEEKCF